MMLFLFRHGKAARQDPDQPRCLTSRGREEVAQMAEHFKKHGWKINHLWHSPKTRAIQTAEIFLETIGKRGIHVEEKKDLKPEGDARAVFSEINAHRDGALLVVSHLPFIEELASLFAHDSPDATLTFPTAGMVAFEKKSQVWKWLWSRDPHSL